MKFSIAQTLLFVSALCMPFDPENPFQIIQDTIQNSPVQQGRQTLVLDLDETLVHSTLLEDTSAAVAEGCFRVDLDWCAYDVKPRPGVEKFLEALAQVYELVLYTAGKKEYAEPIINHIDQKNVFKFQFYQDACLATRWGRLKSLNALKERNENNTFAIDDRILSFGFDNPDVIVIPAYKGQEGDDVLIQLLPKLLDGPLSVDKIKEINQEYRNPIMS